MSYTSIINDVSSKLIWEYLLCYNQATIRNCEKLPLDYLKKYNVMISIITGDSSNYQKINLNNHM